MKEEVLLKLDELVNDLVESYKSDWFKLDRPRVVRCNDNDKFVVMLRDTGCDSTFLSGDEVSYENLLRGQDVISQTKTDFYAFYDGVEIRQISEEEAKSLFINAFNQLPDDYRKFCEQCQDFSCRVPLLSSWNTVHAALQIFPPDVTVDALAQRKYIDLAAEFIDWKKRFAKGENPDEYVFDKTSIMRNQLSWIQDYFAHPNIPYELREPLMVEVCRIITGKKLIASPKTNQIDVGPIVINDRKRKKALKCLCDYGIPSMSEALRILDKLGYELFNHRISSTLDAIRSIGDIPIDIKDLVKQRKSKSK